MAARSGGWVFIGFPDEHLRTMLTAGTTRLWEDARTIGKADGQPVLFLQTREQGAAWIGSGVVRRVEERWKAFGVVVETRTVLPRLLPVVAHDGGHPSGSAAPIVASIRDRGMAVWENRTLAARLGFAGFRSRTPYLEEARDLRLSASDWDVLCQLQPSLRGLWPE
jgi:hypothetical protein